MTARPPAAPKPALLKGQLSSRQTNAKCRTCGRDFFMPIAAGHEERCCPKCVAKRSDEEDEQYLDLLEDELIGAPGTPNSTLSGLRRRIANDVRSVPPKSDCPF